MFRSFRRYCGVRNLRRFSNIPPKSDLTKISEGVGDIAKFYNEKRAGAKFWNYARSHPFKTYFKIGGMFFGGVFVANSISGLVMDDPPISPYKEPQSFAAINLMKSSYFGLLWPSVPFMVLDPDRRKELFVLGHGVNKLQKSIDEEADKNWITIDWNWGKTKDDE